MTAFVRVRNKVCESSMHILTVILFAAGILEVWSRLDVVLLKWGMRGAPWKLIITSARTSQSFSQPSIQQQCLTYGILWQLDHCAYIRSPILTFFFPWSPITGSDCAPLHRPVAQQPVRALPVLYHQSSHHIYTSWMHRYPCTTAVRMTA